jgi:ribulose 1,5-bisphosphate carboxylase large subunit-like protein
LADSGADLLVAGSSVFGHPEGCIGGVRAIQEALGARVP